MPSAQDHVRDDKGNIEGGTEAEVFANEVLERVIDAIGSRPITSIGLGMLLQCFAIAAILTACWFLESGAILVWWCEVCVIQHLLISAFEIVIAVGNLSLTFMVGHTRQGTGCLSGTWAWPFRPFSVRIFNLSTLRMHEQSRADLTML